MADSASTATTEQVLDPKLFVDYVQQLASVHLDVKVEDFQKTLASDVSSEAALKKFVVDAQETVLFLQRTTTEASEGPSGMDYSFALFFSFFVLTKVRSSTCPVLSLKSNYKCFCEL
jgi:hypothetical protein